MDGHLHGAHRVPFFAVSHWIRWQWKYCESIQEKRVFPSGRSMGSARMGFMANITSAGTAYIAPCRINAVLEQALLLQADSPDWPRWVMIRPVAQSRTAGRLHSWDVAKSNDRPGVWKSGGYGLIVQDYSC